MGKWLAVNGEGIYGTRAWKQWGEGQFRFTKKGAALYAMAVQWPAQPVIIKALPLSAGKVKSVSLLCYKGAVSFQQNEEGLTITFPAKTSGDYAWVLKIDGIN